MFQYNRDLLLMPKEERVSSCHFGDDVFNSAFLSFSLSLSLSSGQCGQVSSPATRIPDQTCTTSECAQRSKIYGINARLPLGMPYFYNITICVTFPVDPSTKCSMLASYMNNHRANKTSNHKQSWCLNSSDVA